MDENTKKFYEEQFKNFQTTNNTYEVTSKDDKWEITQKDNKTTTIFAIIKTFKEGETD